MLFRSGNATLTASASTLTVGGAISDASSTRSLTKDGAGTLVTGGNVTIGGNLARNHLRSRARRPEVPLETSDDDDRPGIAASLPAAGGTPDEHAQRTETQAAVRDAVQRLPDDLREAIVLCELEDRSVAEAAGILTTTVKAVESRLHRARQQLRTRLSRWLTLI